MPNVRTNTRRVLKLGRRKLASHTVAFTACSVIAVQNANAQMISVSILSYGGNGNNSADNTAAFNSAFSAIASAGGGSLYIPAGIYIITGAISYSAHGSISIHGDGEGVSIISVNAAPSGGTAISISTTYPFLSIVIKDLGISPGPSGSSGYLNCTALAVSVPTQQSGGSGVYGRVELSNLDFNPFNSGSFAYCLALTNVSESSVRDVFGHSNGSNGVAFATCINCIDLRFQHTNVSGNQYGIIADSTCQGLQISNSVFNINQTCVYTYQQSGQPGTMLLDLFIKDSIFQTTSGPCLSLTYVNYGFISDSSFDTTGYATVVSVASTASHLQFQNCTLNGPFSGIAPASGFSISGSTNQVNDCSFYNVSNGVYLSSGATVNTGRGVRMYALGASNLIGTPGGQMGTMSYAVNDASGNATNEFEWVGPNDTTVYTTKRNYYSQP